MGKEWGVGKGHINYTVFIITGGDDGGQWVDAGEDRVSDASAATEEPRAAPDQPERGGERDGGEWIAAEVQSRCSGGSAAEEGRPEGGEGGETESCSAVGREAESCWIEVGEGLIHETKWVVGQRWVVSEGVDDGV